jgi:hypothetical protein
LYSSNIECFSKSIEVPLISPDHTGNPGPGELLSPNLPSDSMKKELAAITGLKSGLNKPGRCNVYILGYDTCFFEIFPDMVGRCWEISGHIWICFGLFGICH